MRENIPIKYKWKIEDIFPNQKAFDNLYEETKNEIEFSSFKGRLGEEEIFKTFLEKEEVISKKVEKLYVYAMLLRDTDTKDAKASELLSKAVMLLVKFNTETSFVLPELTALPEEVLKGYIENPKFSNYDYNLKQILKKKPHVLSEESENILALGGDVFGSFNEIFTKIDNADLPLGEFTHNGKTYVLSHGEYSVNLQSSDRELREKSFKEYYKAYEKLINTISSTYYGNVKKNVFLKNARKYNSCLEMALLDEDVDVKVYENLISSVSDNLKFLHKYMDLKKKALKLDDLHFYDLYTPIIENQDFKLEYEEAYAFAMEGLKPLGEEYQSLLKKAFDERWIDVYETDGKRSGAYSTAIYDVHPYVLLNYKKTTHDIFTIVHELGHSLHSYYSNKNQCYQKADYKIFVAEVASTVNEVLLLKHILSTVSNKELKKYVLSYFLEMIRTTLFRQTQFAEFEYEAHKMVEEGQPLSKEVLSEKYLEITKKYYGEGLTYDKEISLEWSRIPHFYRAFYVYKYATGITAAISIADRILNEKNGLKDYFNFLSSGGSSDPVSLLRLAGIDLETKEPFIKAMKTFEDILTELENLL
ncbi:MAG: oligoendopeptidase F [Clostridiales bacterium]|nr:oligoendopeptidase F [Clostridiales bacterium]